jgi:hypothetical protein
MSKVSYPAKAGYPVRRSSWARSLTSRSTGSPAFAGDDGCGVIWLTTSRSRRAFRASFALTFRPPQSEGAVLPQEGSRECRTLGASAAACAVVESTRVSHHGHAGNVRHSPRNGFNGFLRALPGDRALLPPSPRRYTATLDASVGASGPHDFAVRKGALSSGAHLTSTASRPAFVTIASAPPWDETAREREVIWVKWK